MVHRIVLLVLLLLCAPRAAGQPGGGRGMVPNVTQQQAAALVSMNSGLQPMVRTLTAARTAFVQASLTVPPNEADLRAKAEALRAAELALAKARADAFHKLQESPNRLAGDQLTYLAGISNVGPGRGRIANLTPQQAGGLQGMYMELRRKVQDLAVARSVVVGVALTEPRKDDLIEAKVSALIDTELALAKARGAAFATLQASDAKLLPEQIPAFAAMGGAFDPSAPTGGFTEPEPLSFEEHEGYVSLFDGQTLKGWDGNPKFWRVENGIIVGESTPENPSGNSYLVCRDVQAHDFTLKFEIKVEGDGGSGMQYRSQTGQPWLSPIPLNVIANTGPVNLDWMMTGPQADFWPSRDYTGQFYTENNPMRIMAWRGQVVEGAGLGRRRLMGTIGDRRALNDLVRKNDWNQYTVIARGGTFIHIVNGQLMAVMVDDDTRDVNNQSGMFGIEIEATTKVSVRNIWLKKLN
jgi:hypothetical protein